MSFCSNTDTGFDCINPLTGILGGQSRSSLVVALGTQKDFIYRYDVDGKIVDGPWSDVSGKEIEYKLVEFQLSFFVIENIIII